MLWYGSVASGWWREVLISPSCSTESYVINHGQGGVFFKHRRIRNADSTLHIDSAKASRRVGPMKWSRPGAHVFAFEGTLPFPNSITRAQMSAIGRKWAWLRCSWRFRLFVFFWRRTRRSRRNPEDRRSLGIDASIRRPQIIGHRRHRV